MRKRERERSRRGREAYRRGQLRRGGHSGGGAAVPDAQHLVPYAHAPGRDETCPVSTGGGTRGVQSVRKGGGGGDPERCAGLPGYTATTRQAPPARDSPSPIVDGPASVARRSAFPPRASASASRMPCSTASPSAPSSSGAPGRDETCPVSMGGGTRRVRLVWEEGRDVSGQYGREGDGGGGSLLLRA